MREGIIRTCDSPNASPIVFGKRKNGELKIIKKFFTTLDPENSFHQVPMHEESIKYTAFVTPLGEFEYCFIPFGLKNAGSEF